MSDPTLSTSDVGRLRERVLGYGDFGYALLDGAWFSNIENEFSEHKIFARPLFLGSDVETQRAGPWLVPLRQSGFSLNLILEISQGRPCVVFWRWLDDDVSLFKHLRRLNSVTIPLWAADGLDCPGEFGNDEHRRAVLFRHWDPRTLSALMPVLNEGQFAHVLGTADELSFVCSDYGGFKVVPRNTEWAPPRARQLFISSDQLDAMATRRKSVSRQRIVSYLREVAPEECSLCSSEQLDQHLTVCEKSASGLGFTQESDIGKWAYVLAKNNWQAGPCLEIYRRNEEINGKHRLAMIVDHLFHAQAMSE